MSSNGRCLPWFLKYMPHALQYSKPLLLSLRHKGVDVHWQLTQRLLSELLGWQGVRGDKVCDALDNKLCFGTLMPDGLCLPLLILWSGEVLLSSCKDSIACSLDVGCDVPVHTLTARMCHSLAIPEVCNI